MNGECFVQILEIGIASPQTSDGTQIGNRSFCAGTKIPPSQSIRTPPARTRR
jgi:hypothetical protein